MPRHQFYNTRDWLKLRAAMLRREPVCRACRRAPATDVDHITPIRAGGSMTHPGNLQCLCHECHSRKTLSERLKKRVRVKGCNADGTPRDPQHPWNTETEKKFAGAEGRRPGAHSKTELVSTKNEVNS